MNVNLTINTRNNAIIVNAFKAINNKELSLEFCKEHTLSLDKSVIGDHSKIKTNNNQWIENPDNYVIAVMSKITKRLIGGVRIQLVNGITPLPLEEVLKDIEPSILDMLKYDPHKSERKAELCALWNNREEATILGITAEEICVAALAITAQLNIDNLYIFTGKHVFNTAEKFGFKPLESYGNKGIFLYPNDKYISKLFYINPKDLIDTDPLVKKRIVGIRENLSNSHFF